MNPRVPNSPPTEGLPRRKEADLISAAAGVFRTGFPNAERIGCPSQETLQSVAKKGRSATENEGVLEHLTSCSPCFVQYEQLLHRERTSKNIRLLAFCASVLIALGLSIWFYAFRGEQPGLQPEPKIVQKDPSPAQPPPVQYEVAVIDLRKRSAVRGEQPTSEQVVASLPTRALDLSVYLPIGSEVGQYEIQIARERDSPLVTARGSATLENRIVVLRSRVNLADVPPGPYLIGVRKGNFRWMYYPVALVK